ncbi:MAG: fatty acid desaturase CarF family protein [Planctomycetota bacterium]
MIAKSIGTLLLCWWSADFLTGFFHWLEDTYCLESMPLIGGFICEPNIEHHLDPHLIVRVGTFFSRNVFQWALCGVIFSVLFIIGFGNAYSFLTLLFASFGNEVHRWNHMSRSGPWITFVKETGLIQSQRQHALHHRPPHTNYYCVLSSQLNPVLERLCFWRGLEQVVQSITGIKPKRKKRRDSVLRKNGASKPS